MREQTLLLCVLIACVQMTWGAIVPALPLYLDEYGLAVGALGPILAAFAVGRALVNAPAGLALRWWRPRAYLWAVCLALVVVTALTGLATTMPVIVAMRFVAGVFGGAAVTVAFAVLVTAAPPERRGTVVAWAMMAMTGAVAVGAVLGAVVVEVSGVVAAFVAAVVPLCLVLAWEARRPPVTFWGAYALSSDAASDVRTDAAPDAVTDAGAPTPASPSRDAGPGRTGLVSALCGVSFATFFVRFAGEQGLVPVMAYDGVGMRPTALALAITAGTVVSLVVTPWVGRLVDRGTRTPVLVVAGVLGALGIAAMPLLSHALLFSLALVVYSAATTSLNVVPGVVAGESWGPRDSGAVVGLTRTVGDVGAALGPLVVFWLVERTSWVVACGVMGAILVVAVAHLVLMTRTPRGRSPRPGSVPEVPSAAGRRVPVA